MLLFLTHNLLAMNIDDFINSAFLSMPIQGEGLFIVEGNPSKNDLRVLPADQAFKDNLNCFAWNINTGYQYLAIFTEERLAHDYIKQIREKIRNYDGERLI